MKKISAVIIAKDQEKLIKNALESVLFCDEIIVVDNGSVDKTKKIAQKYAKVYDYKSNSFADLRNFGLSKAENDYVLYLDTDERISDELKKSIRKVLSENSEYAGFFLLRKNYYLGENPWPYIEKLQRLFKKDKLKGWQGKLHESPVVEGKIGELEGFLLHYTHRDLTSMVNKTIEWSKIEAELRFSSNHPKIVWWRFPRVMMTAFLNSYIKQSGYKAGTAGLIESIYQSFSMFITYAKLWEMQQRLTNKDQRTNI